jgi:flagella basal body P-ring formation protein FlgA
MIARCLRVIPLCILIGGASLPALAGEIVFVPNRTIYPGQTVTFDALREVELKPGRQAPDAVAFRAEELDGKVARRTLLPGRYVPLASLREAYLVEQGAPVQVIYQAGALTITATAICLQSGSAGEVVRVRNLDSGKTFNGIVAGDGTVRVGAS